jgi:diguanylate cyclase (GGDEF)-like protein
MSITAGILLPQSTLTEPWFIVLSTVVAFNTIIYLGLTLSKLVPWPRQIHPSRVRELILPVSAAIITPTIESESDMVLFVPVEPHQSGDPYQALRANIARRDIPQSFALVGGLVILLSAASFVTSRQTTSGEPLAELILGLAFLVAAQVLGRRHFRVRVVMWTWIVASLLLVGLLLGEAVLNDSQLPLAYVLIIMTAYAPITLAWRPTLAGAVIMLAGVVYASIKVSGTEDGRIVAVSAGALLVSFVLLQLRLSAIDEIADERSRSTALATTDHLTGALTRQGLITLLPGLAAIAERSGQEVCVMTFDVDDLARANGEYGSAYGDDVLRAVAQAIEATVRRGDLVARWGDDEFLVAGLGNKPSADALAARIQEAVRVSGVNLGKWPTTVSVDSAAGAPSETTFDALVAQVRA